MTDRSILIVDDEPSIRLTLSEALASIGLATETATDGREALDRVARRDYGLILLDLRMPGPNGMSVLHELQAHRPDIPVIIITAHGAVDDVAEALEKGAAGVVQKPFDLDEIRQVVTRHLDRPRREADTAASYDRHLAEARACIRDRHLKAALAHAKAALSLDASRPEAFNLAGAISQLTGRLAEARRYYQAALAQHPGYAPAQQNCENLALPPHERRLAKYVLE